MLDGHNGRHTVADVRPGKVCILLLQNAKFSGILVHHCSKGCLKSSQMSTALCIVDIITEAKNILMKFIDILKCRLNLNSFRSSLIVNRFMNRLFLVIQFLNKSQNPFWFMIFNPFRLVPPLILKKNCKFRIQIRSLMHSAFDFFAPEPCLLKYRIIRKKIHLCAGFPGFPCLWKQAVLQLNHRNPPLITVVMNKSVSADFHIHIYRQSVHHRRANAMKSAACLICRIVKLTACM